MPERLVLPLSLVTDMYFRWMNMDLHMNLKNFNRGIHEGKMKHSVQLTRWFASCWCTKLTTAWVGLWLEMFLHDQKSKVHFAQGLLCTILSELHFYTSGLPLKTSLERSIVATKTDNYLHLVASLSNYTEGGIMAVLGRYLMSCSTVYIQEPSRQIQQYWHKDSNFVPGSI